MSEMRRGIGGYGGITTMNQDQRQGRYAPHLTTLRLYKPWSGLMWVQCLDCHAVWRHPKGDVKNVPKTCEK